MKDNWKQNSDFQDHEYYQASVKKKKAAEFRAEARAALKPCYWYAVLACFLAAVLGAVFLNFELNIKLEDLYRGDLSAKLAEVYEVFQTSGLVAVLQRYPKVMAAAIVLGVCTLGGILFALLVSSPAKLGYQCYNLGVIDGNGKKIGALFRYFKEGYARSIGLNVVYSLICLLCALPALVATVFLVDCVLYAISRPMPVPDANGLQVLAGMAISATSAVMILIALAVLFVAIILTIILSYTVLYRFYFCYMILAEYPEMRVIDALRNSANLMRGNKWRLFCLEFSFIGWNILASLLWGVGSIFLMPYKQAAYAAFYNEIANRQAAQDVEFPSLNPDDYVTD